MKKKMLLLVLCFIAFYTLVHAVRHLPDLLHGRLEWNGESTYMLSIVRIGADMVIAFLFAFFPYLVFYHWYAVKKWFWISAGLALSLMCCFLLDFTWTRYMEAPNKVLLDNYLPQAVFFFTMYAVFGVAFYFIRYSHYKELMETGVLLQNRQSELSFLRSQINPHFLFNNLNNIYSLVYYQSDQALNAIAGLSELLRYMLYDTNVAVTLAKEVVYIEKYIALQQLRYEQPEKVRFKVSGPVEEMVVPPLLFIPFVENAFKHGDGTAQDWLEIDLSADVCGIHFFCSNKNSIKHKDPEGGIGIENVKRRLALLYPGKYKLDIVNNNELFTVKLELMYGK
jgi:two-component system LytT family sensor kinase